MPDSMIERLEAALQVEWDRQSAGIYWWDPADAQKMEDTSDGVMTVFPQPSNDAERFDRKAFVRAVLTAMREPTEAMCQQGVAGGDSPYAAETWSTMIDAALEEGR